MNVHLFRVDNKFDFSSALTECGIFVDNDFVETINHNAVTCLNCLKTKAWADLKETNNETKKAIEEMNEIKEETIKKFKESEPKTYKQKIEIEIDVPCDLQVKEISENNIESWREGTEIRVEFEPKVKQGAELIGCLCGVSSHSLSQAKANAEQLFNVAVVKTYGEQSGMYGCGARGFETYAYPVPAEKLDELKAKLMEG